MTQPPQITCPPNQTVDSPAGAIPVNYPPPTVSDNCPGVGTPTCAPASGSSFSPGTTTVTCSVTDASGNSATCSFTVTVIPCSITCPANISQANDANQCGAVVSFASTATAGCGTVTCSPPSGSFFPIGTTSVTCTTAAGPSCTFSVIIADTQPPTLTCPANLAAVTGICGGSTQVVSYSVTATDNCPGVTLVCVPPSGSTFPLGTTTVTCTATDATGNTATCSFPVTLFNTCVQDDSNPTRVLLWNSQTGAYRFCCNGTTFTGTGSVSNRGSIYTLNHISTDRRVSGKVDCTTRRGEGALQFPAGTLLCSISDRDIGNNSCACSAPVNAAK